MQFDIKQWLDMYTTKVKRQFGNRIWLIGLQGSYGRGEAIDTSDIDVVLILDSVSFDDLKVYSSLLDTFPERNKICGFVSGKNELEAWDKSDLFQFCHDTTVILGSLEAIKKTITESDVKHAIHKGVCNIYHTCVHNTIHEKSMNILKELYKSAAFVLQAIAYLQNGVFEKKQQDLLSCLKYSDKKVLENKLELKNNNDEVFEELSETLIIWASNLICHCKIDC